MKVLVASQNPVKINATKKSFSKFFPDVEVIPMDIGSGVSHQPINEETFQGARNRAVKLKELNDQKGLGADFFVGQDGGAIKIFNKWFAAGAMCIIDKHGREGHGSTGYFELPEFVSEELLNGTELGDVMDKLTGGHNTKQKGGAISALTGGVLNRTDYYTHGLIVALVPFLNKGMYFEQKKG